MTWKPQVQNLLMRYPLMARRAVGLYRSVVPRYTAGVSGVLLNAQREVLLVKHVFHQGRAWGLPGGWMDKRGEEPHQAIQREFLEETRLRVQAQRVIWIGRGALWQNHLDIAYLLEADGPLDTIELCYELSDYGWFALDGLPRIRQFHERILQLVMEQERI